MLFANIRPWSTLREAAPIDLKGAMTEFSRSEIVDENGTRILNNQDADEVLEFLSSPVEGKVIAVKPKEAESKKKWLSLNIASLDSDQGEPTAYVIATTNITALKEKEAELRRQESFYKSIIDALDETITVRDSEGRVVFANGGSLDHWGCGRFGPPSYRYLPIGRRRGGWNAVSIGRLRGGTAAEYRERVLGGCPALRDGAMESHFGAYHREDPGLPNAGGWSNVVQREYQATYYRG